MSIRKKIKSKILYILKLDRRLMKWNDERYLTFLYRVKMGKPLNLQNPQTYNEKLQWLKLYYRIPGEAALVDKFDVKEIVADLVGAEYVIPTLGLFSSVDEIDFDALPNSFVLKCTHDSGGVAVVPDKSVADIAAIREKLTRSMNRNYFYNGREPHYLRITPRIIAEPYVEDKKHGQLLDYKFFCFNGEVKTMFIASDRSSGSVKLDYFDADFKPLELKQPYPNSEVMPEKPERYEEMLELSRKLSQGHPHVRVDLYEANGQIYFGELTFFHFSGLEPFTPAKWDRVWGDWLTLPAPVNGY